MQCLVAAHRCNLVTDLGAKLSVAADLYFPASSRMARGISNTQTYLVGRALMHVVGRPHVLGRAA